jgi:hypothetical protein
MESKGKYRGGRKTGKLLVSANSKGQFVLHDVTNKTGPDSEDD